MLCRAVPCYTVLCCAEVLSSLPRDCRWCHCTASTHDILVLHLMAARRLVITEQSSCLKLYKISSRSCSVLGRTYSFIWAVLKMHSGVRPLSTILEHSWWTNPACSIDQLMLYAELSDVEKKTTILLQTQITSEELSVEAKVCCKHHRRRGRGGVCSRAAGGEGLDWERWRGGCQWWLSGGCWARDWGFTRVLEAFLIVLA